MEPSVTRGCHRDDAIGRGRSVATVRLLLPPDRPVARIIRCVGGLALFGVGISALIDAHLGAAPWDVFHTGVSDRTGIPVGTVTIATGLALLIAWIPLRVRPGLGTILNAVVIGLVVDLVLPVLPEPDALLPRTAMMLGGVVVVAIGSGLYIGAGLGPGPRDGLMTGLARRGVSIRLARTMIEVTALAVGILLGGSVGVGTAVFAFGIGPLVQVFLPYLTVTATSDGRSVHGVEADTAVNWSGRDDVR
jgi:uncharacterized membrane protein YczE